MRLASATAAWVLALRALAALAAATDATGATGATGATAPGATAAGGSAGDYYTLADFARVDKIDAHVHLHGRAERFMAQAMADRFRVLTINVDSPDFPPIPEQQQTAVALRQRYPGWVAFAATFSVEGFGSPGWS
ncbi:MAG TPA: hypothetical protein VL176_03430, partial [Steroidobacteraceae bacterium]|nr:hypothetical protein [Steroidobacteraceae bacterium]